MPHDARAVANFILDASPEHNIRLTHLALQKVLYFAHAWYLAKHDAALIGQPFEAWKHGPVVRVVYDQFRKMTGAIDDRRLVSLDVESATLKKATSTLSEKDRQFLIDILRYYGRFDARKLVDLTHEANGPWEKVWKKAEDKAVLGMVIPNALIKQWFVESAGVIREENRGRIVN